MQRIFEYLDYRSFLRDYYEERKKENHLFSYRVFADRAGFKSKSFLVHIMEGKANLSNASIASLATALKFNKSESRYFERLVAFNQETDPQRKERCLRELGECSAGVRARTLLENEYDFYTQWYHSTIRELVTMIDFNNDYTRLARMIRPAITPAQARKSVALLLKLGLITHSENRYLQTNTLITTGDEVTSTAVSNFHLQNLEIARKAQIEISQNQRDISCIVGSMSTQCFSNIKTEMQQFRKRIMEMIRSDPQKAEQVYHINFQIFPTSNHHDE